MKKRIRTNEQNRRLHFLFYKLGFDGDMKAAAVESVTSGRTEHSSEMSILEAQELITLLNEEWSKMRPKKKESAKIAKMRQNLRRSIFRIMYDLGYINNTMNNAEKILTIETFLKDKTKISKHFNSLNIEELNKTIRQLQVIRRNYAQHEENKAKWN